MRTWLCLFLLGFSLSAFGQDTLSRRPRPLRVVLKVAPLTHFDIDPTAQGAVEVQLGRLSLQQEGGYGGSGLGIPVSYWLPNQLIFDKRTLRLRTEVRYYLDEVIIPRRERPLTGLYLALEAFYKQIDAKAEQYVGSAPSRLVGLPVRRGVWGGHQKFGYQFALGARSRFLLDVYAGAGLRHIRVRQRGGEEPISRVEFFNSRFLPGRTFWAGSVSGGFKMGYLLGRESNGRQVRQTCFPPRSVGRALAAGRGAKVDTGPGSLKN